MEIKINFENFEEIIIQLFLCHIDSDFCMVATKKMFLLAAIGMVVTFEASPWNPNVYEQTFKKAGGLESKSMVSDSINFIPQLGQEYGKIQ